MKFNVTYILLFLVGCFLLNIIINNISIIEGNTDYVPYVNTHNPYNRVPRRKHTPYVISYTSLTSYPPKPPPEKKPSRKPRHKPNIPKPVAAVAAFGKKVYNSREAKKVKDFAKKVYNSKQANAVKSFAVKAYNVSPVKSIVNAASNKRSAPASKGGKRR